MIFPTNAMRDDIMARSQNLTNLGPRGADGVALSGVSISEITSLEGPADVFDKLPTWLKIGGAAALGLGVVATGYLLWKGRR